MAGCHELAIDWLIGYVKRILLVNYWCRKSNINHFIVLLLLEWIIRLALENDKPDEF